MVSNCLQPKQQQKMAQLSTTFGQIQRIVTFSLEYLMLTGLTTMQVSFQFFLQGHEQCSNYATKERKHIYMQSSLCKTKRYQKWGNCKVEQIGDVKFIYFHLFIIVFYRLLTLNAYDSSFMFITFVYRLNFSLLFRKIYATSYFPQIVSHLQENDL